MTNSYFRGGGFFEKLLRFFNVLEPDHMVLSISKIAFWGTGFLFVFAVLHGAAYGADLVELAGAVSGFGVAGGNYGYRKYLQTSTPTPALVPTDPPNMEEENASD